MNDGDSSVARRLFAGADGDRVSDLGERGLAGAIN
jgi:hypothetical protein